jgi:hypothetical protein
MITCVVECGFGSQGHFEISIGAEKILIFKTKNRRLTWKMDSLCFLKELHICRLNE